VCGWVCDYGFVGVFVCVCVSFMALMNSIGLLVLCVCVCACVFMCGPKHPTKFLN
jgi:hypothetical protein